MSEIMIKDNQIANIQIGEDTVRGRIVRLATELEQAICADYYPAIVAQLLGEAVILSALIASSLKFDGRLLVQAHGTNEGAVSLLVAECTSSGNVRSYARFDQKSLDRILTDNPNPDAKTLLGGGTFAMTIDSDIHKEKYQGIAAIEGADLADAAENYFKTSEQVPTIIKLAVGRVQEGDGEHWRGSGILVQRIASDAKRSDASDDWDFAKAVMATLKDVELLDPDLPAERLLYRLFHEHGVRIAEIKNIKAKCSCSRTRLLQTIKTFDEQARTEMLEDGKVTANCQFCRKDYVFSKKDIGL